MTMIRLEILVVLILRSVCMFDFNKHVPNLMLLQTCKTSKLSQILSAKTITPKKFSIQKTNFQFYSESSVVGILIEMRVQFVTGEGENIVPLSQFHPSFRQILSDVHFLSGLIPQQTASQNSYPNINQGLALHLYRHVYNCFCGLDLVHVIII